MASKVAAKPLDVIEDPETGNRFVVYTTKAGVHLELHFDGEEPWFTQLQIADIFGVSVSTVNEHIAKFFADGELDAATIRKFRIVRQEGTRQVETTRSWKAHASSSRIFRIACCTRSQAVQP